MNGSVYVGKKALSLTEYEKTAPISGVILWVDDDNCYEAGDETGTVIEQDCPYASQEMANSLLATLQGYSYQGLEANGAKVSPIAELGDGLAVDGLYTQLAYQNIRFSTGEVMDVAAPGSDETLHEYKTEGQTKKQFTHQIAETKSLISKTSEEILLQVENELEGLSSSFSVQLDNITGRIDGLDGQFAELSLTLDGLTVTDSTGKTVINGSMIQTSNLYVNAANISGTLTANQINLTGAITWGDLDASVQNDINDALSTAEDAYQLASGLELPSYIHSTYIGPTEIESPTIIAGEFYGNEFNVYPQNGNQGSFNLYGDTSASSGYHMLEIAYNWTGYGAFVDFTSPADAEVNWDFSRTRYYGYIDFSGANVTGLDGASGDTLQGTYCDILATRDINMETDSGDVIISCNGGDVRIACNDGEFRIYVDGTTWRLGRNGWYS